MVFTSRVRRWLQRGVRAARRSRIATWLREDSSSSAQGPGGPGREPPQAIRGYYRDRDGRDLEMIAGYRDWLKPAWRTMFDPPYADLPAVMQIRTADHGAGAIRRMTQFLVSCNAPWPAAGAGGGGRVLEIGCHLGFAAYALAIRTGVDVLAIDLPEYYIQQQPGKTPSAADLAKESARLTRLRGQVRAGFQNVGVDQAVLDRVSFRDIDISQPDLPAGGFQAVVSWEVLEHLRDPAGCFRQMARLLAPGGIGYHEYNPFFAIDGGHSLGALDIPFGHIRLDAADYEAHLHADRPDEAELDLQFYRYNLNRMTMADLRDHIADAGLELVALVPWPRETDVPLVPPQALEQARRHYPRATFLDLITRFVTVVTRKPS